MQSRDGVVGLHIGERSNMSVLSGSQINMVYGYYMDPGDVRHCVTGTRDAHAEQGVRWHVAALCGDEVNKARYLSSAVRDITCLQCFQSRMRRDARFA